MAAATDWPTTLGTMTGWGPSDTLTVTFEPKGWAPADASGAVVMTWPVGTVELYWLDWAGTKPAAVNAAAAAA